MKLVLVASILGLAFVGCADKNKNSEQMSEQERPAHLNAEASAPVDQVARAEGEQVIHFTGPMDLTLELKTKDNFQTAELRDNSDAVYHLKSAVAASGVKLANRDGVSIHFKNFNGLNEGTVELVKDKPIEIKEYREH